MHSRRTSVAIMVALLVLTVTAIGSPGRAVRAAGPTACTFNMDNAISPGLSTSPSSGTFTSNGETGTITCDGPVNGKQPSGPGKIGQSGHYQGTCQSGGSGDFVATLTIPTSSGAQHVTDTGTLTFGGIQGGLFNAQFQGDRMSGTAQVRPTQGDCVTTPTTKAHETANGTLH